MRKLIILAVSLVALAAIAAPLANAAVTYNDAGVGTVDKGDVMHLFDWNEAEFQNIAKNTPDAITFNNKKVDKIDWTWSCSDGSTPHWIYTFTTIQPLSVAKVSNQAANKVTGWKLNGFSGSPTYNVGSTGPTMGTCPTGTTAVGGVHLVPTPSTNIVQVTHDVTYDLPVTPVEVPAV
jgi:hypothetical protein